MPTKAELYAQMADKVATQLTGSWQEWAGFLTTASRLYKYPFHEQLMIYAQRPDATACAEYDLWNEKMGRYVRRGSKGIALVDDSGDRPRLRYVFDISDTGTREHSRTPWLWQLEERHLDSVQAMLERTYDVSGDDLAGQLTEVAGKLAEEYWAEHQQDFFYIVDGSFLEEYDEFNIGVQFKAAATVSITYALMSRCGLEPEHYFDHEDFMAIFDFNTPSTIGALGTAVSQINQKVLVQLLAQQHLVVEDGTVFLQVGFPHPAVFAQRFLRLLAQLQVGNQIVSVLDIGHGIVHLVCSFLGWLRALHFGR